VRDEWSTEDLVESWTLVDDDWSLVANKSGATRLGFALLQFFEMEARFPTSAAELPAAAVAYVASQVDVVAEKFASYAWTGRAIERHRVQIRNAFGFREFSRGDEDRPGNQAVAEVTELLDPPRRT